MWPRTKGSSWEPPTPGGDGGACWFHCWIMVNIGSIWLLQWLQTTGSSFRSHQGIAVPSSSCSRLILLYNDWLSSCSPRRLQPLLVTDQGWPCSLASNTRWTTEVHHLTWGKCQIKPDSKQRKGKMHQPYHVRKGSSPRVIQDKAAVESTNLP